MSGPADPPSFYCMKGDHLMSYYRTCPRCGANLDPGETCNCLEIEARALIEHVTDKKTAPSAANTEDGKETQQSD